MSGNLLRMTTEELMISCSCSRDAEFRIDLHKSEEFKKPRTLLVLEKVLQYTSNLHGSTPPICIAVPSWLLSLEERETQQYTSHLYCKTPPHLYGNTPPFVQQYF